MDQSGQIVAWIVKRSKSGKSLWILRNWLAEGSNSLSRKFIAIKRCKKLTNISTCAIISSNGRGFCQEPWSPPDILVASRQISSITIANCCGFFFVTRSLQVLPCSTLRLIKIGGTPRQNPFMRFHALEWRYGRYACFGCGCTACTAGKSNARSCRGFLLLSYPLGFLLFGRRRRKPFTQQCTGLWIEHKCRSRWLARLPTAA